MSPWGTVLPMLCPRCGAALTKRDETFECRSGGYQHYKITVEEVEAITAALNADLVTS